MTPAPSPDTDGEPRQTLFQRVVLAFGLFAFLLAFLSAGAIWGALLIAEDQILERTLRLELKELLSRQAQGIPIKAAPSPWLHATFDIEELPAEIQPAAGGPDGFQEVWNQPWWQRTAHVFMPSRQPEYCLLTHTLENGERIYLYVDARQVEVLDSYMASMTLALGMVVLLVTGIGILLGRSTGRRVIAPVTRLAEKVAARDSSDPDPPALTDGLADDEVGMLARALEASEARSRAFLERERRFTRDASHELRSPLTIVHGAVELLESLPEAEKPPIARPLARIRRAADQMSQLIEAFLWLAREEALSEGEHVLSLAAEIETAVDNHRHLIDNKSIDLRFQVANDATVRSPRGALGIVIGNLMANAFFYTQAGQVDIRADNRVFEIADSGPGIPQGEIPNLLQPHQRGSQSSGYGLGLAICRDLCARFGWTLELGTNPQGQGTLARVRFQ